LGGRSKTNKQIADFENTFFVADDVEIGYGSILLL